MSHLASKFLTKHKAWLERTREYLESSDWHEKKLEWISSQDEEGKTEKPYGKAKNLTDMKESMVKNDRTLATNVASRLKYFLKKTDGEKHLAKNKEVVAYLLEIIDVFLANCEDYLTNTNLNEINDQSIRNLEIQFQDLLFNTKIKLEDSLDDMGALSDHEDVDIVFYKKEKASLLMREPLVLTNPDIDLRTKAITGVDWNVAQSNEMLVNMKPKDIPPYNHRKHYFEQDLSTIQFWQEEANKMKNGININGYFMHPWMYHHLNIFKTKIPVSQKEERIMCPPLRDNEWFFVENLKTAEDAKDRGLMLYGTRRFSKSTIMASYIEWKAKTKFNSVATLTGGNESDLVQLLDKVDTSMMYSPEALKLIVQKTEGERTNGTMHLGLKPSASELLDYSQIKVQNLAAGSKRASQKTAGGAPSAFVVDEIGKFAFLMSYLAALPSFATPYGFKCVPILSGTGGEADLSLDAMKVISNPEAYNMIPMDWDLLESKIDPEHVTWKRRTFVSFMPGQMGYEVGFKSIERGFGEFLGIKNAKDLDKVIIKQADWANNRVVLDERIAAAKKETGSKGVVLEQQKRVQNPQDPEDCFITIEGNPFPSEEAKLHKNRIIETGDTGRKVFLSYDDQGNIIDTPAEEFPLADFPFAGGFIDAPIQLFEPLPLHKPAHGLYVAGMDDYKHDQSDGDSVGTLYIYKRQWFDPYSLTIVASYAARPNPRSKFDRQCHLLLKAYNAICFHENEDNNFKTYLDGKHETELYMAQGFDFAAELNLNNNGNRKYGWQATTRNIDFGYGLIKKALEAEVEVTREDGTKFTILGVQRIKDVGLLEEIQNFTKDGNFDRLRGYMGALMYSHFLDARFDYPRVPARGEQEKQVAAKKKTHTRVNPFRKQSHKPYRG